METELSQHSHRTTNFTKFLNYLMEKKRVDNATTSTYYANKCLRNWTFKMFCQRKRSEDKALNRLESLFDSGWPQVIYLGDWSRTDQLKGCALSPTTGLRKMLTRQFSRVIVVDEFRTSLMCNACQKELQKYRHKNDNKMSYSRLCCVNCSIEKKMQKRFVDRDVNAAKNILLVGISRSMPTVFEKEQSTVQSNSDSSHIGKDCCYLLSK